MYSLIQDTCLIAMLGDIDILSLQPLFQIICSKRDKFSVLNTRDDRLTYLYKNS